MLMPSSGVCVSTGTRRRFVVEVVSLPICAVPKTGGLPGRRRRYARGKASPFGVTTANATRATRARVIWLSVVAAVGLGKAEAQDEEPAEEIRKLRGYLKENQGGVKYGSLRRKGYPIGSGGIESAICGWGALETVGTQQF